MNWCVWFSLAFAPHSCTLKQCVLFIIFDRMQTITNGIIYFFKHKHLRNGQADGPPYLVSHSLETWCIYYTAHPYGRYWHLAKKTVLSFWNTGKELVAPGAPWARVIYSIRGVEMPPFLPLINLKCPNNREVGGCFGPEPRVTQRTSRYDFAAPPSAVMRAT